MKKNMGAIDKTLRIIGGLFVISLAFWGPKSPWAYLGLIPLITGLIGFCPLYTIFGVKTTRRQV